MLRSLVSILCFVSATTAATAGKLEKVKVGEKIAIFEKHKVSDASCEAIIPSKIFLGKPKLGSVSAKLETRPVSERGMGENAAYGCVGMMTKHVVVYYTAGKKPGQEAFTLTMQYPGEPFFRNSRRANQTLIRVLVYQD